MDIEDPNIRVLKIPATRDADELATLHAWGNLPEVLPVPELAGLLAHLCKQNKQAITKVLGQAILDHDIPFFGMSHNGGWVVDMVRVLHRYAGKPRVRMNADGEASAVEVKLNSVGQLHIEAMGIRPKDAVALLVRRGRRVPNELQELAGGLVKTPDNVHNEATGQPLDGTEQEGDATQKMGSTNAELPTDPKEKRKELLRRFREKYGGKRTNKEAGKGRRGALAALERETGIDDKNLGVMLDKAIDEERQANLFAGLTKP